MTEWLSIDLATFITFLGVTAVMMLIPGADMAFIISRSLAGGRKQGIATALGMQLGFVCHIFIAAIGLAAILVASPIMFQLIKYAGAVYLIYLGVSTLKNRASISFEQHAGTQSVWHSFSQGAITNILNPKNALFFLTFLPQFINANAGHEGVQFIVLGAVFAFIALVFDLSLVLLAHAMKQRFMTNERAVVWQKNISGAILIVLALVIIFDNNIA